MFQHKSWLDASLAASGLLISSFILLLMPFIRNLSNQPPFSGIQSYYYFNRLVEPSFFNVLVDSFSKVISLELLAIIFPLVFGIGSLCLFYTLIKGQVKNKEELYATLALLLLTPTFLQVHYGLSLYAPLLFFSLLFFFLFSKKSYWYLPSLVVIFLLDTITGLFMFGFAMFYLWFLSEKKQLLYTFFAFLISIVTLSFFSFSSAPFLFSISSLFTFFGARYGFSLIILILGLGGLLTIDYRKRPAPVKTLQLVLLVVSLFYEPLRILALVLLSFYGVKLFFIFLKRKWSIEYIGQLTIILFICIFMFSTSTYIKEQTQSLPFSSHVEALSFLEDEGVILTDPSLGEFIDYSSDLKPFAKETLWSCERCGLANELFASQSFNFIKKTFTEQEITYVLVDDSMLEGTIWQREDQGLLYVLAVDDRFRLIYKKNGISIYQFV